MLSEAAVFFSQTEVFLHCFYQHSLYTRKLSFRNKQTNKHTKNPKTQMHFRVLTKMNKKQCFATIKETIYTACALSKCYDTKFKLKASYPNNNIDIDNLIQYHAL